MSSGFHFSERFDNSGGKWLSFPPDSLLGRGEIAEPVNSRHSAIHEKVAARDEGAIRPHEECTNIPYLIWVPARPAGEILIMRR